jgi:hypothetical protein
MDAVGEVRGVERRGLEGLVEAVHIEQHVARGGRRVGELADLRHRLDRLELPVVEPHRGKREAALVRRDQLAARERCARRALGTEPGIGAAAIRRLAVGGD